MRSVGRDTVLSIQTALVVGTHKRRGAADDGFGWDEERLSAREECETNDVTNGQSHE